MIKLFNISKIKFLLIGEIHGIRENVDVLKIFIQNYLELNKKFVVAFEWPSSVSLEINEYLSGKIERLLWRKWDFINDKDGRISKQHIAFLSWLKKKNLQLPKNKRVSVICFDENPKKWNDRDKMMAQNIREANFSVIAIMGNLHAKKTKFELGKEKYIPVGFRLLGERVVAVKINYLGGKFYNHGIKSIEKSKKMPLGLIESKDNGFDYLYVIKDAHPVALLKM